ncbi:MAG: Tol-Pal system protein TolB [Sphingomonas sp.]|nr:Tol-Pal system protein TolB [Sphingomonas sp.]
MIPLSRSAPNHLLVALCAALFAATPAAAQQRPAPNPSEGDAAVIAVPTLATDKVVETDAGSTWALANQIADLISADLRTTNRFIVADVKNVRIPSYPEVTAPAFPVWRSAGTKLLLSGFVNARSDGRLTIGCYVYDVQTGRELARQGFAVAPSEWRRAAHRCADAAYTKVTGDRPLFDSRIAYVAQSGRDESPTKRIAVMDFDGGNHSFLTEGDSTVITPRWSPQMDRIAYSSFSGGTLHVRLVDVATGRDGALLQPGSMSFAPAFSPDGERIAFSMPVNGNTDIYMTPIGGAYPQRLTSAPSVDTSPGYSPDGRQIAFSSDRSGAPQLYVMDSDGSNQRRISFGQGEYGSPVWSPDGERIAFTNVQGTMTRVGVMNANGSDERILSAGPSDEQPTWSPDSRRILFQRVDPAASRTALAIVAATGGEVRPVPTPMAATDPVWAGRQE